ncbi:KPN_02809 family neutral zinc metallopeptidase [Longispora fulva]|uniref:Putative metalloprotease n=1 Tax=Longispora fulva TaxID=619741 RepID=A0A8J7GIM5_9ACTN|nr:neutral zinc metallopeptidase [Longispora fulva]MBG6141333.1 putative metalloprotease [Longispora fulva]
MEFNEKAEIDTSQVEDASGSSGGGSPFPGGMSFPGADSGGGGGGGLGSVLGGRGGLFGGGIVGLLILCLLGFLGVGGNLGGMGGLLNDGGTTSQNVDNSDLQSKCAVTNPDRFKDVKCRNTLFVNSIQNYWRSGLQTNFGRAYQLAPTQFFSGSVNTACGNATSGVGPFYCPGDKKVYIDLSFYDELAKRFGAPGQFAQAYVLAHEYGHHVQNLLGTEAQMRRAQQRDPGNANQYSVMLELQADCYAGVWAKAATATTDKSGNAIFTSITQQDINEALTAAAAVGDDAIQKKATGSINKDSWTHGSSVQRQQWFGRGFETGDPKQCNTFGTSLG